MTTYTAAHWGVYEVEPSGAGGPRIRPVAGDPDPSPIGLHQLDPGLKRTRVRRPAVRKSWLEHGPGARTDLRGHEPFVEVDWDRALDLVAAELERVRTQYGNQAIFGGSYGWASAGRFHHAQSQVHRFLNTIGGYVRHLNSYSLGAAHVILPHVVASMTDMQHMHTSWDVMAEHTELFVTFGGVPAKNAQMASGGSGLHRVPEGLRQMQKAGVKFVNIGPVDDNLETGGQHEWIPARPNSDVAMMLGLAWTLVDRGLCDRAFLASHCVGFDRFERYLTGADDGVAKTPAWAEALCGVPAERIEALAIEMAGARTMLNVAWSLQRAHHGEQPFWMVITLAAMLGQIGLPGGGFGVGYGAMNTLGSPHRRLSGPRLDQGRNAVDAFIPVARIADLLLHPGETFSYDGVDRTYPDIHLVYWAGGNPYHHHQDLNRMEKAWQKPDTIVVNEQCWTATAKRADVVFPATNGLERDDISYATQEGVLVATKQVVPPFAEARHDFDIFCGLAERMGVADAFTEGRDADAWLRHIYEDCRDRWSKAGVEIPAFDTFRDIGLVDLEKDAGPVVMLSEFRSDPEAHPLTTPSGKIELFSERIASFDYADCPGHATWMAPREWLGSEQADAFPLHLISDQPARKLHSQLDDSPLSRDGKVNGREPLIIHPDDAARRGIAAGDVVEVFNARGRCLAAAVLSDKIMPGAVRMSTGAWFDPDPETGLERHGNPNVLTLDIGTSSLSQGCAAHTCLVEVRGPVNEPAPVRAFEPPELISGDDL